MNRKIIDFYEGKNIQISEAVKRGLKQGLTEPQILEGLEKVYQRVSQGKKIKDISLVWEAWEEAKKSQGREYLEWCKSRDEYMDIITAAKKEIAILEGLLTGIVGIALLAATIMFNWWINAF